jgi:hypothetical protein
MMSRRTRFTVRDSLMSRAARAMFAFLFRNALPVDGSAVPFERDDLRTLRRIRERAMAGTELVTATTYLPSDPTPRRRRTDRPASDSKESLPRKRAS